MGACGDGHGQRSLAESAVADAQRCPAGWSGGRGPAALGPGRRTVQRPDQRTGRRCQPAPGRGRRCPPTAGLPGSTVSRPGQSGGGGGRGSAAVPVWRPVRPGGGYSGTAGAPGADGGAGGPTQSGSTRRRNGVLMMGATPLEGQLSRQVGLDQDKYRLALALALSGRLFWLQIIQGEQNRVRARENSVRVAPSQPIRGQMLDRHGEVLVASHLVHKLYVWPKQAVGPNWRRLRQHLSTLLGVPEEELEQRRANSRPGDYRIALTDVLTPAQTIKLLEQADELEGAEVGVDYLRAYPHSTLAAHALGYTSPVTDEELYHLAGQGYQIQDRIGRTGLEAAYEQHLRGQWGGRTLEVSANGNVQRPLGEKPSVPGKDLQLTLDLALQQAAEKAIANYPVGAIVAMNPQDGAI
ncbi:MAG TPA: hypothetical protein DD643_03055, partial [Synechococcus sp. UBA8638]|nr:hypothetical protein [Synechococcus sp. UBA8638]